MGFWLEETFKQFSGGWPIGGSYTNDQYEYVELYNISAGPATLYDYVTGQAWKFTDGIEFTFPDDPPVTIPAGGVYLWPIEADGGGKSLTRKVLADYGNDPANWLDSTPSPGE